MYLASMVGVMALASIASADNARLSREFNERGNITIADQFNNRVIEVDPSGNIVWSFGRGPNDFSAKSIIGCNDAQRVGNYTLMAGTGTPAGVIPQAPNGVADTAPISWLIANDVKEGRKHLNLSDWPDTDPRHAAKWLDKMSDEISSGEMPLKKYTQIHADARLTESQRKELTDWLDAEVAQLNPMTVKCFHDQWSHPFGSPRAGQQFYILSNTNH